MAFIGMSTRAVAAITETPKTVAPRSSLSSHETIWMQLRACKEAPECLGPGSFHLGGLLSHTWGVALRGPRWLILKPALQPVDVEGQKRWGQHISALRGYGPELSSSFFFFFFFEN